MGGLPTDSGSPTGLPSTASAAPCADTSRSAAAAADGASSSDVIYRLEPDYRKDLLGRLWQGEFIENVTEWIPEWGEGNPPKMTGYKGARRPLAVVITQNCDLRSDWDARNGPKNPAVDANEQQKLLLPSVILCEVRDAEQARASDKKALNLTSDAWAKVRQNKNDRLHYLAEVSNRCDLRGTGCGAMLVDFRSVFALQTAELFRQLNLTADIGAVRRFRLNTPWAEHLLQRFSTYHSRIGLSRDHFVPSTHQG